MTIQARERQYQLTALQELVPVDVLPAGVSLLTVKLPPNSYVVGGGLSVTTPFNATGAATASIGLTGGSATAFTAAVDIKTGAAYFPFTAGVGTFLPQGGSITVNTALTAGATAGKAVLKVDYVILGRGNEVQN